MYNGNIYYTRSFIYICTLFIILPYAYILEVHVGVVGLLTVLRARTRENERSINFRNDLRSTYQGYQPSGSVNIECTEYGYWLVGFNNYLLIFSAHAVHSSLDA